MGYLDNKKRGMDWNLFGVLMINSFMWALTIVLNLIVFYNVGYHTRLYPVLMCGTVISIVAVVIEWKKNKKHTG